ncbi:hypothetical protein RclHR1_33860001 [Rhizophagus clarus]|uniref:BED-type domain-containing protein n=1 Tax=Rhizophagus clarus TaxID=94130 RepID=A0A2Z6RA99_9GLOM|nr:hypothetical protein RclHR1_33860001 [Rhizophagus clarus]GES90586.1 hypothetical protein RCL_e15144_RclHR1_33860001 [Rhizophagus clarus]
MFALHYFFYLNTYKIKKLYTHFNMTSTLDLEKNKNKGSRPSSSTWENAIKGNPVGSRKYYVTCKYCNFLWS